MVTPGLIFFIQLDPVQSYSFLIGLEFKTNLKSRCLIILEETVEQKFVGFTAMANFLSNHP